MRRLQNPPSCWAIVIRSRPWGGATTIAPRSASSDDDDAPALFRRGSLNVALQQKQQLVAAKQY